MQSKECYFFFTPGFLSLLWISKAGSAEVYCQVTECRILVIVIVLINTPQLACTMRCRWRWRQRVWHVRARPGFARPFICIPTAQPLSPPLAVALQGLGLVCTQLGQQRPTVACSTRVTQPWEPPRVNALSHAGEMSCESLLPVVLLVFVLMVRSYCAVQPQSLSPSWGSTYGTSFIQREGMMQCWVRIGVFPIKQDGSRKPVWVWGLFRSKYCGVCHCCAF